ncbi:MAG: ecotin [Akkermansiaceae bacterium]
MKIQILALSAILMIPAVSSAADNMKAFPPAAEGMVRYVLPLPKMEDESFYKVELIVGKTVQTDRANRHFFAGKIEAKNIEGWGFTRYVVDKIGPMAGTRIGVDPNAPKIEKFVKMGGPPYLIRYNSRLPIVVYVPEGAEVRYKIWSTEAEMQSMDQG